MFGPTSDCRCMPFFIAYHFTIISKLDCRKVYIFSSKFNINSFIFVVLRSLVIDKVWCMTSSSSSSSSIIANREVSSAYHLILFEIPLEMSLIYNRNRKGTSNKPWGTPASNILKVYMYVAYLE